MGRILLERSVLILIKGEQFQNSHAITEIPKLLAGPCEQFLCCASDYTSIWRWSVNVYADQSASSTSESLDSHHLTHHLAEELLQGRAEVISFQFTVNVYFYDMNIQNCF